MNFDIVTYCGVNYADALRFTLPSWIRNSGARNIIIYTDKPTGEFVKTYDFVTQWRKALPAEVIGSVPVVEGRCIHSHTCADPVKSWDRKIDVLEHDFLRTRLGKQSSPNWIWLDSDCYTTKDCHAIFHCMEPANIAGMRTIGRTIRGRGQANAGVIPFRYSPTLAQFFADWRSYAVQFRGGPNAPITNQNMYYEQTAFSHLVLEAFDGLRPYYGAVLSEHIWNAEEDSNAKWIDNIAKYKPRIIHFKGRRWADKQLRERALLAAKGPVTLLTCKPVAPVIPL